MPIESEFIHRGYTVRLKGDHKQSYKYFILTNYGPHYGTATSVFDAKRQAQELINDWTTGDWTHVIPSGTVQCTPGDGDVVRRAGELRRGSTEETIKRPVSGTQGQKGRLPTFGTGGYIAPA